MQIICICGKGVNLDIVYINAHDSSFEVEKVPLPKGTWKIGTGKMVDNVTCSDCGASIFVECRVRVSRFDGREVAGEGIDTRKEKGKEEEKENETGSRESGKSRESKRAAA